AKHRRMSKRHVSDHMKATRQPAGKNVMYRTTCKATRQPAGKNVMYRTTCKATRKPAGKNVKNQPVNLQVKTSGVGPPAMQPVNPSTCRLKRQVSDHIDKIVAFGKHQVSDHMQCNPSTRQPVNPQVKTSRVGPRVKQSVNLRVKTSRVGPRIKQPVNLRVKTSRVGPRVKKSVNLRVSDHVECNPSTRQPADKNVCSSNRHIKDTHTYTHTEDTCTIVKSKSGIRKRGFLFLFFFCDVGYTSTLASFQTLQVQVGLLDLSDLTSHITFTLINIFYILGVHSFRH
ncbi:hypothetical protein L9F63_008656, partial [Diploptera punctata]